MAQLVRTKEGIELKVFDERPVTRSFVRGPGVTILSRGTLTLNRAAAELLGLPDAIELLYSEEERIIGIRAAKPDSPRSFSLRPNGNGSTYQSSGKSFIDRYNIPHSSSIRYPAVQDQEGLLLVDLKAGGVDVSMPPRSDRASE